jgi:hypothetical protein
MLGLFAALVVLPATSPTVGQQGPEVHVPSMQNVPAEGAPKLKLEVDDKPQD